MTTWYPPAALQGYQPSAGSGNLVRECLGRGAAEVLPEQQHRARRRPPVAA
jgi:hypothetical protein